MGVRNLTGISWHLERVHRAEGDEKRYKGRCEYYKYRDNFCSLRNGKCIGSAHCDDYSEISDEAFKFRQKNKYKF